MNPSQYREVTVSAFLIKDDSWDNNLVIYIVQYIIYL